LIRNFYVTEVRICCNFETSLTNILWPHGLDATSKAPSSFLPMILGQNIFLVVMCTSCNFRDLTCWIPLA